MTDRFPPQDEEQARWNAAGTTSRSVNRPRYSRTLAACKCGCYACYCGSHSVCGRNCGKPRHANETDPT